MTEIRFETMRIMGADLGPENPLADIQNVSYIHATFNVGDSLTEEDGKNIGKGTIDSILPYMLRDNYTRDRREVELKTAVIENERLRAVFLPDYGGRLWSLFDKKNQRELLYVNTVFQPCNLAIRNAWFSGGIEWNIGIKGHTPLTCEPMFVATSVDGNGDPVLSLYEYERKRGLVYSINARIIEDRLYISTTVENTSNTEKYMYWWSNIAVLEEGVRVFVPAKEAFVVEYGDDKYGLTKKEMPFIENIDSSYPEKFTHSGDLFYDTKADWAKWISAIGKDGYGLLQYSTPMLQGRKVFFWGNEVGGRRWNEFLSDNERKYIEIQAGILKTQMEHIPMPANTVWSWTEVYTACQIPLDVLNGEWQEGNIYFNTYVESKLNDDKLAFAVPKDKRINSYGSGWGAFERKFRNISNLYDFPENSMDDKQEEWLELIEKGYISYKNVDYVPKSYCVGEKILDLLKKSLRRKEGNHWLTHYYIGVAEYELERKTDAFNSFNKSVDSEPNYWAYRNLATFYKNELFNQEKAVEYILLAYKLLREPYSISILKDLGNILTACKKGEEWLAIVSTLNEELRASGRIGLYTVIALMQIGKYAEATKILNDKFEMADIKEGEISVSQIWVDLYSEIEKRGGKFIPLPKNLDFRMVK